MAKFLVFDLKVIDSPQAGTGVARSLKEAGHTIYGGDDTMLVTRNPNIFDEVFLFEEVRSLNIDSLLKKLTEIKKTYGLDYIVPCYDETAILFSYIKDKLDFLKIRLIAPEIDVIRKFRKDSLQEVFADDCFVYPKTYRVEDIVDAKEKASDIGYPVFVKGVTKGAIRVANESELEKAISTITSLWNGGAFDCLIQKSIEGGKYFNILVCYNGNGDMTGYAEMEKIALDPNGATWFGKILKSDILSDYIRRLFLPMKLKSCVLEVETVFMEKENKFYVYEVNYRPPAWIHSSTMNGLNFMEQVLSEESMLRKHKKECYFGRESGEFIIDTSEVNIDANNLTFFSKGAAYKRKGNNTKYPSELML